MCRRGPGDPIAVPDPDIDWLVDWRYRVAQGETFHDETTAPGAQPEDVCERWTRGFIACNLILDLSPFFHAIFHRDASVFVQGVTFADFDDWITAGTIDPVQGQSLQTPAALAELQTADPHHVWRRINHWLALEVVLRHLQGVRQPGSVSVSWQAEQTFTEPFPDVALDTPSVCRWRSPAVLDAYRHWFDSTANCLAEMLATTILPDRERFAEDDRGGELNQTIQQCLEMGPLTALVRAKNEQLQVCIGQLNRGESNYSVEPGWLGEIRGRVHHARRFQQSFWWGRWWDRVTGKFLGRLLTPGRDCTNLRELVQWLRTHPDAEQALGRPVNETLLAGVSSRGPCEVPTNQLAPLEGELEAVSQLVRRRGLPADWGESLQVRDLFFHPLSDQAAPGPGVRIGGPPPGFEFGLWYNESTRP